MNKRIKKKQKIMKNKKLCKRYPFLIPRGWNETPLWRLSKHDWRYTKPYEFTELVQMPEGWSRAFGKEMCEEIRQVLVKANYLYDYRVVQIKEKYGSLRWYDAGAPSSIYRELQEVINKYEEISERTCICCGRPATKISLGWISPFCDRCAGKLNERVKFKEID